MCNWRKNNTLSQNTVVGTIRDNPCYCLSNISPIHEVNNIMHSSVNKLYQNHDGSADDCSAGRKSAKGSERTAECGGVVYDMHPSYT